MMAEYLGWITFVTLCTSLHEYRPSWAITIPISFGDVNLPPIRIDLNPQSVSPEITVCITAVLAHFWFYICVYGGGRKVSVLVSKHCTAYVVHSILFCAGYYFHLLHDLQGELPQVFLPFTGDLHAAGRHFSKTIGSNLQRGLLHL